MHNSGSSPEDFTGVVLGPVVLKNGYAQGIDSGNGRFTTAPVGYQIFHYDMPAYEGPQLTSGNLIGIYGFTPEDIKPVASRIELRGDTIELYLDNIVAGGTYMLQFKNSLEESRWINVFTFTHQDLDENGALTHEKESLSGFFRVSLL
jgi:hypothetical protein